MKNNMRTITPIEYLNNTTSEHKWEHSDLLTVIAEATTQIDEASGWDNNSPVCPSARDVLTAIYHALNCQFKDEYKEYNK